MSKPRARQSWHRWLLVLPLCAGLFLCAARPAGAAAPQRSQSVEKLDLADYQARLGSLSDSIAQARGRPGAISQIRQSLPPAWSVDTGNAPVRVSTAWLQSALHSLEDSPGHADQLSREIEVRVAAMRAAADELQGSPPPPSVAAARRKLAGIFRRREFRGSAGPGAGELLAARLERWLFEHIAALLRRLHVPAAAGNVLTWALIAVVLLLLSVWVVVSLRRPPRQAGLRDIVQSAWGGSRHWLEEAQAAASRGDFREAVHCAYWAAMARLEELDLLVRDPARTPRESLRLLDTHPDAQKPLADLTRWFERIWYGFQPVSAADWSNARERLEQVQCLRGSTAQTANS